MFARLEKNTFVHRICKEKTCSTRRLLQAQMEKHEFRTRAFFLEDLLLYFQHKVKNEKLGSMKSIFVLGRPLPSSGNKVLVHRFLLSTSTLCQTKLSKHQSTQLNISQLNLTLLKKTPASHYQKQKICFLVVMK